MQEIESQAKRFSSDLFFVTQPSTYVYFSNKSYYVQEIGLFSISCSNAQSSQQCHCKGGQGQNPGQTVARNSGSTVIISVNSCVHR